MRYLLVVLSMLMLPVATTQADVDVSVRIAIPGVRIGINVPAYPRLVRIPGHPVYYDPAIRLNLFFYDGLYWVFQGGDWYVSSWYNGPWDLVDPYDVPLYVLLVPVRYYRVPPPFFHGWAVKEPPRWGEHWGHDWKDRRKDWDRHERPSYPKPAPLPSYQRKYSGERYPHEQEQQRSIRTERYRYEPREEVTRKHYEPQRGEPQSRGQGSPRGDRGDRDKGDKDRGNRH